MPNFIESKSNADSGCVRSWVMRAVIPVILVGILTGGVAARANQITTAPGFGPFQIGSGGEFTVTPDAGVASQLGGYSPFTINQGGFLGSFQTFCIEANEDISPNTTYDVTFNTVTVFTGKALSVGAAYLYQQFAIGALNYNYANVPAGSRQLGSPGDVFHNAYYLQHALSFYMGEYSAEASNPYEQQVSSLFGAGAFNADGGAHHVSVLNLWLPGQPHDPQHSFQDVLIYTPVPEPTALALFAVAGLLVYRRRK